MESGNVAEAMVDLDRAIEIYTEVVDGTPPGSPDRAGRLNNLAIALEKVPKKMTVIGGGIIGLEMACVYEALGSKVSVVELTSQLMPGCDADLVRPGAFIPHNSPAARGSAGPERRRDDRSD